MQGQSILQPLAVSVPEAAKILSISTRTAWTLVRNGTFPAVRLGKRVLIPYDALQSIIASADRTGQIVDLQASQRRKASAFVAKEA